MSSLTAPSSYAYPNTRVRAMRGLLLKETDIKALIGAKDLESYVALLEHTPYRENFGSLEMVDIDSIENALFIHLIDVNRKLRDIVPGKSAGFLAEYARKYEIELLKRLINNSERKGKDYAAYHPVLSGGVREIIGQLAESKKIADIVELLKSTEYARFMEEIPVSAEQKLSLITAMDRYYFGNIWKKIDELSKTDQGVARMVIGTEIDMINMMTILRASKGKYDADKFFIPVDYRLGYTKEISGLANVADFVSRLSNTVYGGALERGLQKYEETNSLLSFELNLKSYLLQRAENLFIGYPFHIGISLGFIIMKEMEVECLREIAVGINSRLPSSEIEGMIVR